MGAEFQRHTPGGSLAFCPTGPGRFDAYVFKDGAYHPLSLNLARASAQKLIDEKARTRPAANVDAAIERIDPAVRTLLEAASFTPWHPGGGCMAWGREAGPYALLIGVESDLGDGEPIEGTEWGLAFEWEEYGGSALQIGGVGLPALIRIADALPTLLDELHGQLGEDYPTFTGAAAVAGVHPSFAALLQPAI